MGTQNELMTQEKTFEQLLLKKKNMKPNVFYREKHI